MTAEAAVQQFDHDPAGRTSSGARRIIGLDVTRALALIGVVVMNYHGYLNGGETSGPPTVWDRLFHPWTGVLSTRFAATFVLVAGMGVTLLDGGMSPFHHARRRLALLEAPHMHTSMAFVPTGEPLPDIGRVVDVPRHRGAHDRGGCSRTSVGRWMR